MESAQTPIYVSPPVATSLWQEYRIYPDRLELECKVGLQTIIIPTAEIVGIEVRPPLVFADVFRGKSFFYSFALKIDFADGFRHVAIERKYGLMKHIRFTPKCPEEFVKACRMVIDGQPSINK